VSGDVKSLISRIAEVLANGPPVRLAILFGSGARDALRPTSDVDVGVLFADEAPSLGEELALTARLSSAIGREVDLVRLDTAPALVRWEAARSAVLIHESPVREFADFVAKAALEHADMAPLLERSARTFVRRLAQPLGAK
jgi:predicted nucleotidyltransferase